MKENKAQNAEPACDVYKERKGTRSNFSVEQKVQKSYFVLPLFKIRHNISDNWEVEL